MRIRVLGCSGAIAQGCRTSSFLVDGDLLVDAGTGVGDLTLEEMACIDDLLLSHAHLDHIAALPLMLDAVGSLRARPLRVHALPGTLDALRAHVFNDLIWPDFTRIPSRQAPFVTFEPIAVGQVLEIRGRRIEVMSALHTVPAAGFAIDGGSGCWVYSGDTGRNDAFWDRLSQLPVAALVIETAFSNREHDLARRTLHLSPRDLAQALGRIAGRRAFPVYVTHTKPSQTALILSEVRRIDPAGEGCVVDIRALHAGQEIVL